MDYDHLFDQQISQLKEEGNYRIFAELERCQGNFPRAKNYQSKNVSEVTVWCSNDYLGMGQNPEVLLSIETALRECGAGAGGTRNISGTNHYHILLEIFYILFYLQKLTYYYLFYLNIHFLFL